MRVKQTNKSYFFLFITGLCLAAVLFIPLPYYITEPGIAHELDSVVKVEGGTKEKGELMLTTVKIVKATLPTYLLASIRKYEDIIPEKELFGDEETDEEYNVRQLYDMNSSKNNAIIAAFQKIKRPYRTDFKGVYVLDVFPDMPAEKVLKPGDRIIAVDGRNLVSSSQFMKYVQSKPPGTQLKVTFVRKEKQITKPISTMKFPMQKHKTGIGIGLMDDIKVTTHPKVTINTKNIGGPSAGLMFSLEIYNQLVKQDITKGYKIAGTGTISPDGTVGRIGGIAYKVVAADKAGADIFFAPNDPIPKEWKKKHPEIQTNYQEAVKAAKDTKTNMKIVPVKTLDDALDYLQKLKPKE
ncbi:SepM family pheromone-processing serine protease [Bacillus smithii]|uniref:SepM family pheromone-processing serine protease n=1 Tax=Bacillus smithii TaxID=1479 RepID=UPI002E1EA3F4|nr:SepM family pheromone-processing serine protease [Bacillus smithii]